MQVYELYEQNRKNLDLNRDYPINPDGFIIMPLIGEVRVKGLTVYEVMKSLEEKLGQHLSEPYVYVRPLIRVTLQGAFNNPGAYHSDPSSSLWDLVALAGEWGLDGYDLCVRPGYPVSPDNATAELPRVAAMFRAQNLLSGQPFSLGRYIAMLLGSASSPGRPTT